MGKDSASKKLTKTFQAALAAVSEVDGGPATTIRDAQVLRDAVIQGDGKVFEDSEVAYVGGSIIVSLSAVSALIGLYLYFQELKEKAEQDSFYYYFLKWLKLNQRLRQLCEELGLNVPPSIAPYFSAEDKYSDEELEDVLYFCDPNIPTLWRSKRRIMRSSCSGKSYKKLKNIEQGIINAAFKKLQQRIPEFNQLLSSAEHNSSLAAQTTPAASEVPAGPALNPIEKFTEDYLSPSARASDSHKVAKASGKVVSTLWKGMTAYSIFYWIGWFCYWTFSGISQLDIEINGSLPIWLSFGIPALPIVIFMIAKVIKLIAWLKKPAEYVPVAAGSKSMMLSQRELRQQKKKVFLSHYLDVITQLHHQQKASLTTMPLESVEEHRVSSQPSPRRHTKIAKVKQRLASSNRARKIVIAALAGFMLGYIALFFVSWPVSSLLVATKLISGVSDLAVFIVSTVIGVFCAFRAATKASIEAKKNPLLLKQNQAILNQLDELKERNRNLRNEIKACYAKTCQQSKQAKAEVAINSDNIKLEQLKPIIPESFNDSFLNTLKPQASSRGAKLWTNIKNFLSWGRLSFFCAGTGILLFRSIVFPGAVFAISNWYILIGLAIAGGLIWAAVKIIEKYKQDKEQKAKRIIEDAPLLLEAEARAEILLTEQLKQQQAILRHVERMSSKQADGDSKASECLPFLNRPAPVSVERAAAQAGSVSPVGSPCSTGSTSSTSTTSSREGDEILGSRNSSLAFLAKPAPIRQVDAVRALNDSDHLTATGIPKPPTTPPPEFQETSSDKAQQSLAQLNRHSFT